jgi:hypothetical protein
MNPPNIDRRSRALSKEIHAKIRADAKRELEKRMGTRANAEWLRLAFPGDYRGTGGKIAISATAIASGPVMTEERLHELQEIRQRLIQQQKGG